MLPGASDDVSITGVTGTITHSAGIDTVNSIMASAPIILSGGTLSVLGSFSDSSAVTLAGGTLANATIAAGTAIVANSSTSTLNDVTLSGLLHIESALQVTDTAHTGAGLTLGSGGSVLMDPYTGLTFVGTQTLAGSGTVTAQYGSVIGLSGSNQTLTIAAGITIKSSGASLDVGSNSLVNDGILSGDANVGPGGGGFTINGTNWVNDGTIQAINSGPVNLTGSWTNDTTISADGGTVSLHGSWTNRGTLYLLNSGTLSLGGTVTLATLGTVIRDVSATTLNLTGTLNLGGQTLDSTRGALTLAGGTINGGTVSDTLLAAYGNTLNDVTLSGLLHIETSLQVTDTAQTGAGLTLSGGNVLMDPYSGLTFAGTQTLAGSGTVTAQYGSGIGLSGSNQTLTIAAGITIKSSGASLDVGSNSLVNYGTLSGDASVGPGGGSFTIHGSNWVNDGTIQAINGGPVNLSGSWTNSGTIEVDVGPVNLSGSWTNSGTIEVDGGTLYLAGAWTNTGTITAAAGSIVNLGGAFGLANLGTITNQGTLYLTGTLTMAGADTLALNNTTGSWNLEGGTISGGTVSTAGSAALIGTAYGGTLAGVTLAGTLDETGQLSFLDGAHVTVTGGLTLNQGAIKFGAAGFMIFQGTQTLNGTGTATLAHSNAGDGLLVPGGDTLTIAPGITLRGNSGFIGSATGGALVNEGTIEVQAGGTLTVQGVANFSAGTLTGGTWEAVANSTIRFLGADVVTNAATVLLDGAGSHIYSDGGTTDALAGLATNAATGSLTIQNGANLTTGAFGNQGGVTIGAGSTFTAGGNYVTDGSTVVDGSLVATNTVTIDDSGSLGGSGTVTADVSNSGRVSPGNSPGILTVNGTYRQTATGALNLEIGGATAGSQYEQLNVSAAATLGGTLNVSLVNGFAPGGGQTFNVLTSSAVSGSFATLNFPQFGGAPAFVVQLTATNLDLVGTTSAADLAVAPATVAATPAPAIPGQPITVTCTVKNLGTVAATGNWTDSVYLSADMVLSADDLLLGRVAHTGDVAGLSSYTETLTAALPGVIDGTYHIIVVADSGLQVPDVNRANNVAAAAQALPVSTRALALGSTVTGTLANGQDLYYQVLVRPGQDVQVDANFSAADQAQVFASRFVVPTPSVFNETDVNVNTLQPSLMLPGSQGGTYYVLVQGQQGAGTGQPFTLEALAAPLQIESFTSGAATTPGLTALDLTGAGFTPQTTVRLRDGSGNTFDPMSVSVLGSSEVFAAFDLTQVPAGTYFVQALQGGQIATAPTQFDNFSATQLVSAQVTISAPAFVPLVYWDPLTPGVIYGSPVAWVPVSVNVSNPAATPAYSPIIEVGLVDSQGHFIGNPTPFTVSNTGGLFPTLPPGDLRNGRLFIFNLVPAFAHETVTEGLGVVNGNTPIDWNNARPSSIAQAAWNAMIPNLTASLGTTVGQVQSVLESDSAYLTEQGESVTSLGQVMALELEKAEDALPTPILATSTDLSVPAPGLSLSLTRTFVNSIPGRYQLGSFGYGWSFLGDDSASLDTTTDATAGDVFINQGGAMRAFTPVGLNTFQGGPGDPATLVLANGSFVLREADGTVETFAPNPNPNATNWLFASSEDSNGNSIVATRNGSQLILTSSSGASLTCHYNAAGVIDTVAASTGQTVTYTYSADPNNPNNGTNNPDAQYLQSVTGPNGTVSYTYVTAPSNPTAEHALQSIAHTDGTHTFFTYDSQGRPQNEHGDNNTGSITFGYLTPGGYTARIDATNATTTVQYNEIGQPTSIEDASGNIYEFLYDGNGYLAGTILPDGSIVDYGYDPLGNQTSQEDPYGNTIKAIYNQTFSTLASLRDANGNLTTYTTNGQGDLTQITAADGSATQFVPNPNGEVQQLINANGQAAAYSYNGLGEVTEENFGNGVHTDFTYDNSGNLLTATNASGTTTFAYDDAAYPNLVTSVTDPDGRFIAYAYDANGRLDQMNQNGYVVSYAYDTSGRLATMTDSASNLIATYHYNDANQVIREDMGNGTYTTYTYTPTGQIQSLINSAPDGTVNSEFNYTYDDLGNVLTMTTLEGTTTYGYDADSQLTSVVLPNGQTITYGYDAMGNRTTVTQNGVTTAYTTNNLNEYTAVGGATYGYDQDGNLTVTTGLGGTTVYTYNVQNQLIGVQTSTDTWTYTYDALGNLIASTDNSQTTQYLVDPTGIGNVIGEYDGSGNLIANYTQGLGLVSQVTSTGTPYYYSFDAKGSTVGLSGSTGTDVNSYSYLPFGEVRSAHGALANPFQYNGQSGVMAQGNGLVFMRARFYSPSDGRFINADPIGQRGGENVYKYALNNPVSFRDSTGTSPSLPDYQFGDDDEFADTVRVPRQPGFGSDLDIPDRANPGKDPRTPNPIGFRMPADEDEEEEPPTLRSPTKSDKLEIIGELALTALLIAAAPVDLPLLLVGGAIAGAIFFFSSNASAATETVHTEVIAPGDPNFISGPAGYGSSGFVPVSAIMPYTIGFENEPSASAPAQVVTVTQQLDPNLDWSTFQLGSFGFSGQLYPVPAGLTSYSTRIDARGTAGVYVDVTAQLDKQTGVVSWTFTSIDPTTLDVPVGNPEKGFLPPDADAVEGQGFVSYTIEPKAADTTGTTINAKATVIFQAGLPGQSSLDTTPIFNTIDAGPPTSSVIALPAFSPASFTVSWAGLDDARGSGIASFDVYVSDNNGPFKLWQAATPQTSAAFTGVDGHAYAFYSVATDNAGNVQPAPTAAQATTNVDATPPTSSIAALPAFSPGSFTVSWSGSDNSGGSGLASFKVYVSDNNGPFTLWQAATTPTSATYTGQGGHSYGFYSVATDNAGNVEATPTSAQASTTIQPSVTPIVTVTAAGGSYNHTVYAASAAARFNGSDVSDQGTFSFTYYAGPNTSGTNLGNAAPSTAGTFTVIGHFQSGNSAYTNADSSAVTLIITQAPLSVSADNNSRPYGGANPTLTGTLTGVLSGDGITASYTTTATSASHLLSAGYAIVPVLNDPNDLLSNYLVTSTNGTLTITPVGLTITADDKSMVYGGPLPTLTASYSGFVNGDSSTSLTTTPTLATTATASSHVAGTPYPITASGAVDTDYNISYVGGALTVTPVALTITANSASKVYGASLPTLTASYSGFVNGDSSSSLTSRPLLSTTATTGSHVSGSPYFITASGAVDSDYTISYTPGTLTVTPAALTITADNKSMLAGSVLPTLTASYNGFVNGDNSTSLTLPPSLSTTATSASPAGAYPITVSGGVDHDYTIAYSNGALTVQPSSTQPFQPGVYVLNATAPGALNLSGNARINIAGDVFVDSSSTTALAASGNALVNASQIDVTGGDTFSGNARSAHPVHTKAASVADPLVSLPAPATTGLPNLGSFSLGGNSSRTINPGIYTQIIVSANAQLTLNPGIYIIAGGGMTISGNARVTGSGVLIYNAGGNVLRCGNSFGALNVSGNGSINLTAMSSGTYAGIAFFQSRDNARRDSLSGNARVTFNGGIFYAPLAQLSASGNAQLFQGSLVVNELLMSGNALDD